MIQESKLDLVQIGAGKRAHIRYNRYYTFCGLSAFRGYSNFSGYSKPAPEGLPLCKSCEEVKAADKRRQERQKQAETTWPSGLRPGLDGTL